MRVLKTLHVPLACVAAAACALALWPGPQAEARGRGFGAGLAVGVIGGLVVGEMLKAGGKLGAKGRSSGHSRTGGGGGGSKGITAAPAGAGSPAPAAGGYTDVVKWVEAADKQRIENAKREATARLESDRNVDDAVDKFIQDLQQRHTKLWGKNVALVTRGDGNINEVTDGMVRLLVEDAYKQAHLDDFDPGLSDPMWSRERLTVFILRQARFGIESFYTGVGAKGPSADNLRAVFLQSAHEVYASALETSEIMGVSHSFDRFIGKIYRASTGSDDGLPTMGSDGRYEKLVTSVIDSVPLKSSALGVGQAGSQLSLDRQFLFRFRARRTVYDCVSASYASLAKVDATIPTSVVERDAGSRRGSVLDTGGSDGATIVSVSSEVWRRVETHAKDVCRIAVQASVLKAAMEGEMHPQSLRTDNYLKAGETSPIPMSLK